MDKSYNDQLINYGFLQTQEIGPNETATVLIVGLPRSGTSMVAAVLRALGLFIGNKIDNAVFEDHEFAAALSGRDPGRLRALIAARNAAHARWGFKRPEAYHHLDALCELCRNPRVIVTFRDILAIAVRNNISMQIDSLKSLPRLADEYRALAATINRLPVPFLLISYEKALQHPIETVSTIASFCGLESSKEQLEQASLAIENGNQAYVRAARLVYQGFVGKLVKGHLRGWVKAMHRDDIRVEVELQLDGRVIQKTRADLFRPDVLQAGFGDGRYGFAFKIDDTINRNGIVAVRIQNSTILVQNSGLPLSSYSPVPSPA